MPTASSTWITPNNPLLPFIGPDKAGRGSFPDVNLAMTPVWEPPGAPHHSQALKACIFLPAHVSYSSLFMFCWMSGCLISHTVLFPVCLMHHNSLPAQDLAYVPPLARICIFIAVGHLFF